MMRIKIWIYLKLRDIGFWAFIKPHIKLGNWLFHSYNACGKKGWDLINSRSCFNCGADGKHARLKCCECGHLSCVKCGVGVPCPGCSKKS